MAEVTVKPYQPKLTPVDYDPFYDATGVDKPSAQPETVKLAGASLFSDLFKGLKPSDFNPALSGTPGSLQKAGEGFMEGARKSGHAGLESMATALENQYVPEGAVKFDDSGQYYDKDNNPLPTQYRPNILPVTRKPEGGVEGAMPAMLDVWNTLGGPGGLGAGPSLRPALKYMDKIYKAKPGQQHLDALPPDIYNVFQKQALSGEDISNFNFGFMNHKGHFMSREDALKYAIDNGILDPNDAKFKTLVTTMLNQSGGEGKLVSQAGAASKENAPAFYSALEKALGSINQSKASGEQWISTLANRPGVKGEELDWVGLKDFLKDKKNVTKAEIQDYLKNNKVELGEVWKGADKPLTIDEVKKLAAEGKPFHAVEKSNPEKIASVTLDNGQLLPWAEKNADKFIFRQGTFEDAVNLKGNSTKYHSYQLPGATNYRELLLTLPEKKIDPVEFGKQWYDNWVKRGGDTDWEKLPQSERNKWIKAADEQANGMGKHPDNYLSSHWDEPNILAHMRMNDRTIDGKKSLHLEEIQSDWHQQGREKGYKLSENKKRYDELENLIEKETNKPVGSRNDKEIVKLVNEQDKLRMAIENGVLDAPFKKTWHELALKRAIREAAEGGYERLSWTPGEAQAARYDLSKQVSRLQYDTRNNELEGFGLGGNRFIKQTITPDKLHEVIGKEAADKLINNPTEKILNDKVHELKGVDLKIGGEGMKGFYDQIIPKSLEKIAKEFGVKIKKDHLPVNEKQIDKLWREFENTKPDEIATKEHQKDWDEMVKARRRLQPLIDDRNRKLTDIEYEIVKKDWDEVNKAMDQIHEQMIRETIERMKKDLKGEPIFYIDIPPAMRQKVMKQGQPLFSGTPTLIPVDHEPEFEK